MCIGFTGKYTKQWSRAQQQTKVMNPLVEPCLVKWM